MGMSYVIPANSHIAWKAQKEAMDASIREQALAHARGDRAKSYSALAKPSYPTECPSCHSHEFRMHHSRWICSFCRSSAP